MSRVPRRPSAGYATVSVPLDDGLSPLTRSEMGDASFRGPIGGAGSARPPPAIDDQHTLRQLHKLLLQHQAIIEHQAVAIAEGERQREVLAKRVDQLERELLGRRHPPPSGDRR